MSDRVDQLFQQFKAAFGSGEDADPVALLSEVEGDERAELSALIDAYLTRAPRREWDAEAYRQSSAPEVVDALARDLRGQAGLWPSMLPRLRARARIRRVDLVAELADRLGASGQREKVAGYYHEMEQGTLPADGVTDTVLDALGAIVGESRDALRRAGQAFGPGPEAGGPGALFARQASPSIDALETERPASPGTADRTPEPDEVDRLFTGG
jgi:hypothetical protein